MRLQTTNGRGRPSGPRDPHRTASMHAAYSTGLTVPEVAERWGVTEDAVYNRFRKASLPLRPRVYRKGYKINTIARRRRQ